MILLQQKYFQFAFTIHTLKEVSVKHLLLCVLFLGLTTLSSFAQAPPQDDYRLSDITVSSGKGALSSGVFASATVMNTSWRLIFQVNNDFVQAMYGTNEGSLFLAGSGGFFMNTPWVGPYIEVQPWDFLFAVSWIGVSAGKGGEPSTDPQLFFLFHSVRVTMGPFYASHTLIHYQKDVPNHLPGIGWNFTLGTKVTCSIGAEYTLRDKEPLFSGVIQYKL